jgi:hypothetical protein
LFQPQTRGQGDPERGSHRGGCVACCRRRASLQVRARSTESSIFPLRPAIEGKAALPSCPRSAGSRPNQAWRLPFAGGHWPFRRHGLGGKGPCHRLFGLFRVPAHRFTFTTVLRSIRAPCAAGAVSVFAPRRARLGGHRRCCLSRAPAPGLRSPDRRGPSALRDRAIRRWRTGGALPRRTGELSGTAVRSPERIGKEMFYFRSVLRYSVPGHSNRAQNVLDLHPMRPLRRLRSRSGVVRSVRQAEGGHAAAGPPRATA